ncbi:hypothetical protein [Oleiagrimonas soli]|uniref:Putative lipoprotein n=1 Tax=Oleiagrimonas soli TaxID=1543381 RepID=A0A841KDN5_9GAMM|nr:hypothetical protein [Oleiagrimonas soli]MBB6183733.1 putative lipoprotein [Oleiagrimonas soli]
MKKILVALVLSTVLLSGCGLFRSSKSWQKAKQENPLEIPPNMDRPNVSEALTIPTVNAQHEQTDANARPGTLHLPGDVDSAYKRVGLALGNGDIGSIANQNDAEHTYQVAMDSKMELGSNQGFLQRHFSNTQNAPSDTSSDSSSSEKTKSTVLVQVKADAAGGSTVSASGDPQLVGRLMGALRARLGG